MVLYIVRHGETVANEQSRLQGCSDWPLNAFGIQLAEETGRGLKGIRFDAAFTSPLIRAADTANIILRESDNADIVPQIDERIKEINMGNWENKTLDEVKKLYTEEQVTRFFERPFDFGSFPNGESAREVCVRTQDFLFDLAKHRSYDNVLVTSHGFAIRALLNFMYDDKENFWQNQVPYNCSVNIIETDGKDFHFLAKDKLYYDKKHCIDRYAVK